MARAIDYYFSLISPWTYLGGDRLMEIAREHGAEIRVKPVKLSVIFPKTGGLPLAKRPPERQAYRLVELKRWSAHLGMPLTLHPKYFPTDESKAALMVIAAAAKGQDAAKLAQAFLRACWAEERDLADETTIVEIAGVNGFDGQGLLQAGQSPESAAQYDANTEEALAAGVFGSPSYVADGEVFWGQDRLDLLAAKISG